MVNTNLSPEIRTVIDTLQPTINAMGNWQDLVKTIEPKGTACGPVYELGLHPAHPDVSWAIADMRGVPYTHPHYHDRGEVEIYFPIQGLGQVVVGSEVIVARRGEAIVTPSGTTHYALPHGDHGLVVAVLNTPPFNPDNHVDISDLDTSEPLVGYDSSLFHQLTRGAAHLS